MGDDVYRVIANRIRSARSKAGITQLEMAAKLDMSNVGYGAYERGDRQIGIHTLLEVARILNKPVTWFLGIPEEFTQDEKDMVIACRKADKRTRQMVKILLTD